MAQAATDAQADFFPWLLRDHALIEERLKRLDAAAAAIGRDERDSAALGQVAETLDFFAADGARHEAHEEQTLFPRLRELPEFRQILSALEFQHRMTASEGRALAACVQAFAPGSGRELRRLAYRFAEMHRGHAVAEERALFPLATARLAPQVQTEMVRELLARNGSRTAP
jgi:hemerythrin-like domain-containing protein